MDTHPAIAIVGVGAILPDAPNAPAFWENICNKRYSISEVPPDRWSINHYYDPNPETPDKSYTKIGGWVHGFEFDWKRYRIPPRVVNAMDESQQWAVSIAAEALADYGYPDRPLDTERTGVILGTAIGGELHYRTHLRISFPEFAGALENVSEFRQLPAEVRTAITESWQQEMGQHLPPITEDTMPGELPNIISGRVANILNLRGPNFITDAACASSFAAVDAALELLTKHRCDAVITGGVDRNMSASSFVKFCKIGALSATGSRPFGEGADGFVMGEGSAAFLLKRLADAERDGDRIYAVIRGVGGSSDGKGKGITAPNPIGQQLAIARAWENAGLDPATATMIEAHGTSTKVGDVVEVESLNKIFGDAAPGSIALGSAKSNIGHLKAGAGAAGLLKTVMAIHHKKLPPTLNAKRPNPNINFTGTPFVVNHELRDWSVSNQTPRRAGVSAYGFGGTNFHVVVEEHVPGALTQTSHIYTSVPVDNNQNNSNNQSKIFTSGNGTSQSSISNFQSPPLNFANTPPLRGILALGAESPTQLQEKADNISSRVEQGWTPKLAAPEPAALNAPERLVIDFDDSVQLLRRLRKGHKALEFDNAQAWKAMRAQGIFRGSDSKSGKLAFLFPGQGSQYLNMGKELAAISPTVAAVFEEADQIMTPILGKPLTDYIFVDSTDPAIKEQAELNLRQTAITQPAMLTLDIALYKLLAEYGFKPDMVMGHSLGEYAALIVAGIMPFAHALEAAAARGREMANLSSDDNGRMAAIFAPYDVMKQTLTEIDGYVVAANINSYNQCVIGGASDAVEQAMELFKQKGHRALPIPVSHAFHTKIVAPASAPLRQVLNRLSISPPQLPLVANVNGQFYPSTVEEIKDILQQQIASPVQWIKGLETLYAAGARTFIEVGPKKVLKGLTDNVLGDKPDVVSLFTNHPKAETIATFNQALCGLYAAGYAQPTQLQSVQQPYAVQPSTNSKLPSSNSPQWGEDQAASLSLGGIEERLPAKTEFANTLPSNPDSIEALSQLFTQALQQLAPSTNPQPAYDRNQPPRGSVVITGTGLGLPGAEKPVMDPDNAARILRGDQFIDLIPERFRKHMAEKRVTRVVKAADGSGSFETITNPADVIKLAARPGTFNLTEEYGVPAKLVEALDITTQLAMAAGLDALREAGIPLVQTYRRTTTGSHLPDRWQLPEALRDETGVIFASAFPGNDRLADELSRYYTWQNRRDQLELLEDLRRHMNDSILLHEINRRIGELRDTLEQEPYTFDRRFIFRILAMGHSQFAEYIGARGPNTHVNAACASTTQAVSLAEDWIRSGRCRRVLVIAADDVTGNNLMEWIGAGFLATGAAATDDSVEEAALPFDRRRHGTILGMGAAALVLESEDAVRERGMRGIVEVLDSQTNNSAFHGTRLNVDHITQIMNTLVTSAERRFGFNRYAAASQTVFISHETFTPARGGSAAAEIEALRHTFGEAANRIIIANTKGFTGHPMGVGIEDVVAVKILEHGIVPPVPNLKEPDPDLGALNLSRGGPYPVQYALHLAAGFGSQISMTFTRRIPGALDRADNKALYRQWLADVSGYHQAETEVVKRVLRVADQGAPPRQPAPGLWQYGTGPTLRATAPGNAPAIEHYPAPLTTPAKPRPIIQPAPEPIQTNNNNRTKEPIETLQVVARAEPQSGQKNVIAEPQKLTQPAPAVSKPIVTPQPPVTLTPPPAIEPPLAPVETSDDTDPVATRILQIIAEKTGYPEDMLELDLDMEADLGIDTVKQAETFSAIREAYGIPIQEDLSLRDYPTLAHAIQFVYECRPDLADQQKTEVASEPAYPTLDMPAGDPVEARILQIIAEKTGYPEDMLELDLDMEADLGIDTVKQAETFSAIREAYDIPVQEDLSLRDYPTLAHAIQFVYNCRPDLAGELKQDAPAVEEITPKIVPPEPDAEPVIDPLAAANTVPRRVPVPVLRPALDLYKPTGVTLDEQSRVVVMMDKGGIGKALVNRLQKRGVIPMVIDVPLDNQSLEAQLKEWLAEGPIQGVYWLPALDVEPDIEEIDLPTWRELNRQRVKNLYTTMRTLYGSVSGPGTFLVSATHLGGMHGYDEAGATAPLGGAVTGFTKAYKRERNEVLVKAVDFATSRKTAEPADLLIAETLADPGVVEVGHQNGLRYSISLAEQSAEDGQPGMPLNGETVFVITGAAGGITSAIVADLATASGGIFYLLDLVPAPERNDPNIALFRTEKEALKRQFAEELKSSGERPTPVKVEQMLMAVERAEAALSVIETIEAAGGTAHYHSLSLLNGDTVAAVIEDIRREHGRIDVLLHAGGLEISRALSEKESKEFNLVFDVKADGFFNLLKAAGNMPIGATVAFSSVAGRFGNSGQTDYSAANDLLCKITSSLRRRRPETRGIVIDWTAWAGIGMATRGSIPTIMEMAGIDMLPPEAGVPTIRRELTCGGTRGEIVVGQRLGILVDEWGETGGIDPQQVTKLLAEQKQPLSMIGEVKAANLYDGLHVETTLDPQVQPFLFDHQVEEGVPYLPGVMGIEAFAQLATVLAPGYTIAAVENVQFNAPFKFYRNQPRTLYLNATISPAPNGELVARTVLKSVTKPRKSELPEQIKTHFTADVRLTQNPLESPTVPFAVPGDEAKTVDKANIYRLYFHGPAYQVLEQAKVQGEQVAGWLTPNLPPDTSPENGELLMAPRLIELCFQSAGIWEMSSKEKMALPMAVKSITSYRPISAERQDQLYALVTAVNDGEYFDAQVVDESGNVYVSLKGYRTVQLPGNVSLYDFERGGAQRTEISNTKGTK